MMSSVSLTNSNCFDFLATIGDGTADLVCIDPPYEVSRETGFSNGRPTGSDVDRFRVSMDFGEWDKEGFVGLTEVVSECHRILDRSCRNKGYGSRRSRDRCCRFHLRILLAY